MGFLFTSESVSEGHPDKVSDQISDAILDEFLRHDSNSKVACETLCTTGLVVVAGEVRSSAYVDIQHVTRRVINRIGYTKSEYQFDGNSCGVLSAIHEQSPDINQGVVREAEEEQARAIRASCSAMPATKRANTCLRRSSSRTSFSRNWPSSAAKGR